MPNSNKLMTQIAKSQLGSDAEDLLEKIAKFEVEFPISYENLREKLSERSDFEIGDLINLLQIFSEIAVEKKYEIL